MVSFGPNEVGSCLGHRSLPCRALPGLRRPLGLGEPGASLVQAPSLGTRDRGRTAIMTWQNMQENGSSSRSPASSTTVSAASASGAAAMSVP